MLQSELPLPEKLRVSMEIISAIFMKMDREFLRDLKNSLPELWQKIDDARQGSEEQIAAVLSEEQGKRSIRTDINPSLLSALILTVVRGMYNPAFFLNYNVTPETVGKLVVDIVLRGSLTDRAFFDYEGG